MRVAARVTGALLVPALVVIGISNVNAAFKDPYDREDRGPLPLPVWLDRYGRMFCLVQNWNMFTDIDRAFFGWFLVLVSIVATETSAVTFLSVPGVAYNPNGGNLTFLQLAFGYIIGRCLVAWLLLPQYMNGELFSAYEVLRQRFDSTARLSFRLRDEPGELVVLARAARESSRSQDRARDEKPVALMFREHISTCVFVVHQAFGLLLPLGAPSAALVFSTSATSASSR